MRSKRCFGRRINNSLYGPILDAWLHLGRTAMRPPAHGAYAAFCMAPLLELHDLAALLGRSASTIKKDLRRNPSAVPPKLQLPGTQLLRWRASDVEAWLEDAAASAAGVHRGLGK